MNRFRSTTTTAAATAAPSKFRAPETEKALGEFGQAVLASRKLVEVDIPRVNARGVMRPLTRRESLAVDVDTRAFLNEHGFGTDLEALKGLAGTETWSYERLVRLLQKAVRDPNDHERELASLDDWRQLDDDALAALGVKYQQIIASLDPLSAAQNALNEVQVAGARGVARRAAAGDSDAHEALLHLGSPVLVSLVVALETLLSEAAPTAGENAAEAP